MGVYAKDTSIFDDPLVEICQVKDAMIYKVARPAIHIAANNQDLVLVIVGEMIIIPVTLNVFASTSKD